MGFVTVRSDLSDFAKKMGYLGTSGIMKITGEALRDAIANEFETLLLETPQWSGTTTASYNIGFHPGEEVRTQPPSGKKLTKEEALSKGHWYAVSVAMKANWDNLPTDFQGYKTAALIITNNAPGFETAENDPEGKLRDVNRPGGALARFETRFAGLIIDANFDRY